VLRQIYNYYFSKNKLFARELRGILGFVPRRLHFYQRSFTHKSKTNKGKKSRYPTNNERLEFLGDAILDAVTAEYLFRKYPMQDEGFLTQMRSKMVKRKTLNMVGEKMGLEVFLRQHGATRISPTMMGNTFEAFVGAIYLDVGYKQTRKFIINKMLRQYINVHQLETLDTNYKSQLLEYSQKHQKVIAYEVEEHFRTKNNREKFKIAVFLDGKKMATAEDFSKKSAEQKASERALLQMGVIEKQVPLS
jgi:ribonuclease-3